MRYLMFWLLFGSLFQGCGDSNPPAELFGFHASGRGDAPAGRTIIILNRGEQRATCGKLEDGSYASIIINGDAAGNYTHFTGPMDQIPAMHFIAGLLELNGGSSSNKMSSAGGSLTLDQGSTGPTLTGSAELTFEGDTTISGSFSTAVCDLDM